ncbi:MAG TPA: hypothetical protein VLA79_07395 [Polyangia bacterium]|jgi:hypothetical protein|nr:hypothetical protein [Polyangia bacterium]
MSKRNRPTTAAQATHRRLRHAYRSAYNSPEGKAARAAAGKPSTAVKLAATKRAVAAASPTPSPAPKTTTQG